MRIKQIMLLILIVVGLIGSLVLLSSLNNPRQPAEVTEPETPLDFANLPPNITVDQAALTIAYTREEMIDHAEVIFVGKVLAISSSFWNQDSGEYWYEEDAEIAFLQLHTIELEVLRPIVDTLGMKKQVTIYVMGPSPLDEGTTLEDGITVQQVSDEDYDLGVGDQVLFFASQVELAWREGGRRWLLMSSPSLAAFVQRPDGLYDDPWNQGVISFEALLGEIAARRETLIQP